MARRYLHLALFILMTLAGYPGAWAQTTEKDFYKGKTVRLIVGFGPGGGYDVYARMIAPYLAKVLSANVVVENQPGAGGLTALNQIYRASPDGLQMMLVQGTGSALAQITEDRAVRYDLSKVGLLGTASASPWVWLVNEKLPYSSPVDLVRAKAKIRWGAEGPADGLSDGAAMICRSLAIDCQIILGYRSSNEVNLAVAKGEMDAVYVSDTSANNYVLAGGVRAISTVSIKRSRFFPDVPTIFESIAPTDEAAWWLTFRTTLDSLGRILLVPPGLTPERLAFLQAATKNVLTDPQFIDEGERTQRYVDYADPAATRERINSLITSLSNEQREAVKALVMKK